MSGSSSHHGLYPATTTSEPPCEQRLESTCPLLIVETVPILAEALGQMSLQRLAPIVIHMLAELFGEDEPQEDLTTLSTIFLPSSLLVLAPEVSDLGILASLASSIVMRALAAPPLSLSLAPITVLPVVTLSPSE